jgi:DNA-binding transcriptional regulator YiaG
MSTKSCKKDLTSSTACFIIILQEEAMNTKKPEKTRGQRIKEARENMGLSQEEFGALFGKSGRAVGRWERDEVRPKCLKEISEKCNIDANFLL